MSKTPSVQPVLRSRLLPKISFRTTMILTTLAAFVLAIASAANQGGQYAKAFTVGIAFAAALFGIFVTMFLVAWMVSQIRRITGAVIIGLASFLLIAALLGAALPYLGSPAALSCAYLVGLFLIIYQPSRTKDEIASSPFAEGQLPPQILKPREAQS